MRFPLRNVTDPFHEKLREPTIAGSHGRAWRLDLQSYKKNQTDPILHAGVDSWIIEATYAHPIWHTYQLVMVHLRPMEGIPETIMYHPQGTHEIVLHAMHPELDREIFLQTPWEPQLRQGKKIYPLLMPANFASQMKYIGGDEEARMICECTVSSMVEGVLNPDTDYTEDWQAIFGAVMFKRYGR